MKVCEIFASIQGESSYAGLPCVFVRMTGCNLRCSYCDTAYAYDEGAEMTEDAVLEEVRKHGLNLVEITGGEPLLQDGVVSLAGRLISLGYKVLIETNGTLDTGGVDDRAVIIMDVKTPGSGYQGSLRRENIDRLKKTDELKFVITGRADYEWSAAFIKEHRLAEKCAVLFAPEFGKLPPAELAGWIIEDRLQVRFNLQLHKYIYCPDRRAV